MQGLELDRTADAAIACALRDDVDGLVTLVRPLDAAELRRLVGRLAVRAAEGLSGWAADAGATHEDTISMWQHAILRAERERAVTARAEQADAAAAEDGTATDGPDSADGSDDGPDDRPADGPAGP